MSHLAQIHFIFMNNFNRLKTRGKHIATYKGTSVNMLAALVADPGEPVVAHSIEFKTVRYPVFSRTAFHKWRNKDSQINKS